MVHDRKQIHEGNIQDQKETLSDYGVKDLELVRAKTANVRTTLGKDIDQKADSPPRRVKVQTARAT